MNSLLDDVNELLRLRQGDLGRLEHIKATLESRNVLYISDTKYLRELTREYLEDHKGQRLEKYNSYDYPEYTNRLKEKPASEHTSEGGKEAEQMAKNLKEVWTMETEQMGKNLKAAGKISGEISEYVKKPTPEILDSNKNYFCGNCGSTIKNENFCPKCGSSLHIVEEEEKQYDARLRENQSQEKVSTKNEARISKSTLVIIILFGVIFVGGLAMGMKILGENEIQIDNPIEITPVIVTTTSTSDSELDSKCGAGTVFDEASNTCVLEGSKISSESKSKCGAGTVFDEASNTCVLG